MSGLFKLNLWSKSSQLTYNLMLCFPGTQLKQQLIIASTVPYAVPVLKFAEIYTVVRQNIINLEYNLQVK
jgi:hypothetical protein